jgi:hypothetical protein
VPAVTEWIVSNSRPGLRQTRLVVTLVFVLALCIVSSGSFAQARIASPDRSDAPVSTARVFRRKLLGHAHNLESSSYDAYSDGRSLFDDANAVGAVSTSDVRRPTARWLVLAAVAQRFLMNVWLNEALVPSDHMRVRLMLNLLPQNHHAVDARKRKEERCNMSLRPVIFVVTLLTAGLISACSIDSSQKSSSAAEAACAKALASKELPGPGFYMGYPRVSRKTALELSRRYGHNIVRNAQMAGGGKRSKDVDGCLKLATGNYYESNETKPCLAKNNNPDRLLILELPVLVGRYSFSDSEEDKQLMNFLASSESLIAVAFESCLHPS